MAKQFPAIEPVHEAFIARQQIFFTASATADSRVNLSPRSTVSFRVLGPNRVAYLDLTGSGNETAAHMLADGRLTVMMCAFEGPPQILRLYGRGTVYRSGTGRYAELLHGAFGGDEPLGARQIVVLDIDLVQTSCGFGVPKFEYQDERDTLVRWAEAKAKTAGGIEAYQREKNQYSIDGLPTGMFANEAAGAA